MKRRPFYYISVIVAPTFLLAVLCILGIFQPEVSGEWVPDKVTPIYANKQMPGYSGTCDINGDDGNSRDC